MAKDLKKLTVEEMLLKKEELNTAYEDLIRQQNDWLAEVNDLREEMMCRSLDLEILEEEAKFDRQSDYDHLYEAKNQVH